MSIRDILIARIPRPIRRILIAIRSRFLSKYDVEMSFWRTRLELDKGDFKNAHYEKLMLAMAEEPTDTFLEGKIVADFGCGPRGSLVWASSALLRIGIDVLADRYADEFTSSITSHGMIYLKSTEKVIPLPSGLVDVVFTLNAIDHVDDFPAMCNEILRVLRPGGLLIASFNLEGPAAPSEPQRLSEKLIREALLNNMEIQSYRITGKGASESVYAPFFDEALSYEPGREGVLWVRARTTS